MSFILRALVWLWCVLMLISLRKALCSSTLWHLVCATMKWIIPVVDAIMIFYWIKYGFKLKSLPLIFHCTQIHILLLQTTHVQCTSKRRTLCEHIRQINIRFRREKVEYNKHWIKNVPSLFRHIFHFLLLLLLLFQLWIQYVKRDDNSKTNSVVFFFWAKCRQQQLHQHQQQ